MPNLYPTENWHNFRMTRLVDGKATISTDFHMSVYDAAEDAVRDNLSILDVHKVEWKGAHIGQKWRDVTDYYRNLFSAFQAGDDR